VLRQGAATAIGHGAGQAVNAEYVSANLTADAHTPVVRWSAMHWRPC
jgi:hypothetical protein